MRNFWLIALFVLGGFQPAFGEDRQVIAGKDVDGWVAILRDPARPSHERDQAVWVIGEFGAEAKAAVPFLIERFIKLGREYYPKALHLGVDPLAKKALVQIGRPSVPALIEILNGPDEALRVCAADALGEIGPAARDAVPRLIQAVEQPEPGDYGETLHNQAILALGKIGPDAKAAVPILMGELGEDGVDTGVVVALDRIGSPPSAKVVDLFIRDADDFVRDGDESTSALLFYLGPKARAEAPRIRALLADERPVLRFEAAAILVHIDPSDTTALPVLIEALKHNPEAEPRYYSLIATLTWLGPEAKAAMPGLIAWARKAPEREDIPRALVTIDPDNPACVPLLIAALKKEDRDLVREATDCLGLLGPRARDAIPALVELIRSLAGKWTTDENLNGWSTIETAIRAVGRIDPQSPLVISALIEVIEKATALENPPEPKTDFPIIYDRDPTAAAAKVLGAIGPAAKAAVPALIARLRKPADRDFSQDAIVWTLGKIGPEAKDALPSLRELADQKVRISAAALLALHRIEPDNKEWLDRLEQWLARPQRSISNFHYVESLRYKARILGALGRSSLETDGVVRETLQWLDSMLIASTDLTGEFLPEYFESCIEALGTYGAAGREAIPRLNEYRVHRNPWIRLWATEALRQITPIAPSKAKGS
jgi:HEAT repeat protein